MSANSLLQGLLGELAELHEAARDIFADDDTRKSMIRDLGGDPSSSAQFPATSLDSVTAYRDASEPGLEALLAAIQDFRSFHEALSAFAESLNLGTNAAVEEGYALVLDVLGWNLIRMRYPRLYFILQVFSFAEDITSPFAGAAEKEWRPWGHQLPLPTTIDRLLSAAGAELPGYLAGSVDGEDTARRVTDALVVTALTGLKITGLLSTIPGDNIVYGMDIVPGATPSDPPTPAADEAQQRMFTVNFVDTNQEAIDAGTESDSKQNNLVASLAMVPKSQGGPGLFVSFGGGVERSWKLSDHWFLTGELQSAGAVSALIGPDFQFHGPDETGDFRCAFAFEGRVDPADNSKPFNLEIATKTAITADLLRVEGTLTPQEAQFRLQMLNATATLSPDSFDNFIAKILPKDGLRVDFDASVGFGVKRGKFFEGQIRSAGTGSSQKPPTPPTPGAPPPLPPLPPETGPGFGADDSDRQIARPADDPQSAAPGRSRRRRRQEDLPDPGRELDQHEARSRDGARRSRGTEVRRSHRRQGQRRNRQPEVGRRRRRRCTSERCVARDRCERSRERRRLPVSRQGSAGLRRCHAAHAEGAHHRQGIRPDRHENAGRQQRLFADRLHHCRGLPANPGRHGRDATRHRRHDRDQPHVRRRGDASGAQEQDARHSCSRRIRSATRPRSSAT
jgi:hypothetical protein